MHFSFKRRRHRTIGTSGALKNILFSRIAKADRLPWSSRPCVQSEPMRNSYETHSSDDRIAAVAFEIFIAQAGRHPIAYLSAAQRRVAHPAHNTWPN